MHYNNLEIKNNYYYCFWGMNYELFKTEGVHPELFKKYQRAPHGGAHLCRLKAVASEFKLGHCLQKFGPALRNGNGGSAFHRG